MQDETPEITLENIAETPIEDLSEEQTTFIKDNADTLNDEQKETYKGVLEPKEEEVPEDIEPETRTPAEIKKDKEEEEADDDDIDDEDEKTIGKVVDKKLKSVDGLRQEVQALKDEREVDSFIAVKPEFAKYKPLALKYMAHPAYKNIPAHNIIAMVSSNDAMKIGASKEREASKKVAETQSKGNQVRKPIGGAIDWAKVPDTEFEAQKAKVLGQSGD